MKVLLSWLREMVDLPADVDPVLVGHRFGMLGTPVEDMVVLGEGLDGIVVARVLDLRPHPNADKIQLVDVDAGDGGALQICCGAFNMAVGDLVPLATLGTTMPGGMEIARRKLRGEWSNGMLCSAPELGLPGGEERGILVLPEGIAAAGTALTDALGIVPDVLYDLEVNPNRPDAMSVAGLARDLAAALGLAFTPPAPPPLAGGGAPVAGSASVSIDAPDLCGRFTATVLRGVTVRPSPPAIAGRLTAMGMRPINNVVDASNYVMLELGQPNHAYDLATLPGGAIRVRRAAEGEAVTTLDDVERRLEVDDLLICDGDDRPIGIAGIMGGADSEISAATTDVLFEVAWFRPIAISRTARRLGLRSEASARFEKGCDPAVAERTVARFVELLGDAVGGVDDGIVDARGELPRRDPVRLRTARVAGILGVDIPRDDIAALLAPVGFSAEVDGDDLSVSIPSWRPDCEVEIDLVEEVARHHGYDRIPAAVPPAVRSGALTPRQLDRRAARRALVGLGLSEAQPLPFLAPGDQARAGLGDTGAVTITNPLVADESVLRTSLLPGLLKASALNERHRNLGVGLFEIGHVFRAQAAGAELPDEREHLAVAVAGAEAPAAVEAWRTLAASLGVGDVDLRAAEVAGLHPTRAAELVARVDGTDVVVGVVGEVDPDVTEAHGIAQRLAWMEVDLDRLLDLPHGDAPFRPFSRFPSSDVDLAFDVADPVPADAVLATLRSGAGQLLVSAELFDVYRGAGVAEGRRSLAVRLRFQASDRTLTDAEVGEARTATVAAVEAAHDAVLRG